ncbi:uncharacterized protein PSFLO_00211 [Pseudozyma flocculosa]|uniref:Uncharacterized protein n=1 Tax=Pseudozyma flocculosa TaxID=84751 RepID=A0A5C3ESA7_9BASI|nr:uncharacterized protein PSFLO_00211 [Pseudozyma flocculosa]
MASRAQLCSPFPDSQTTSVHRVRALLPTVSYRDGDIDVQAQLRLRLVQAAQPMDARILTTVPILPQGCPLHHRPEAPRATDPRGHREAPGALRSAGLCIVRPNGRRILPSSAHGAQMSEAAMILTVFR